jgi:Calx-beta domain-containing protein/VCBS repeat protein/WD40 repeat protein
MLAVCLALTVAGLTAAAGSAAQGDVDLVSRADGAAGVKANGSSDSPAISADGRFVAFHSLASNLDAGDGDVIGDVFVRDLQSGTTTLVSRATGAAGAKGNGNSSDATISADGRLVAFESGSTTLGAGGTSSDVYVRDLQASTTTLVDRASGAEGAPADAFSSNAAISADGRFVVFTSLASNLSPDDGDDVVDVFVRDLQTNTTTLVSRATGASGAAADRSAEAAAISADGRFVAFSSLATNLDPADPTTANENVFVRDLQTNTTTLVSRASGATGTTANGLSASPAISADGRFVAYRSNATNLDSADTDTSADIYVRDLQTNTTTLASRATGANGTKANDFTTTPQISADGRYLTFNSFANNLDPAAVLPGTSEIYARDLQQNTTTLVSRAAGAAGATASGARPAISADGRYVAFDSLATNLSPDDPDRTGDVYRRDVLGSAAQTARISINDVSQAEGDAGQTAFRFTVSLDQGQSAPVTVDYSTADGTATAPSDYVAGSGAVTFAPGETAKTVTVQVNGDTIVEPNGTFTVNLANAVGNATIADTQAVATIVNDDQPAPIPGRISIDDVTKTEGNAAQTAFPFVVRLDTSQPAPVSVDFSTANGTATAPSDYVAGSGTVTFAPGETAKTVTVQVNGDTTVEPNETFTVNLANAVGTATIADAQAVATIVNDDQAVIGQPPVVRRPADFNGDGRADIAVFRPSTGTWYLRGIATVQFGTSGDIPVPADYNGDHKADIAVFRPSTGTWYLRGIATVQWGTRGDIPVPADYNGDGKADIAVFRPSTGIWYIRGIGSMTFGTRGDVPVPADYNGDHKADPAVYRPSTGYWYISGQTPSRWGLATDLPVPADYNGDGKADVTVFRPSTGAWLIRGIASATLGTSGDVPVPADYNGDHKAEPAVFRPSTGNWLMQGLPSVHWGTSGDIPV